MLAARLLTRCGRVQPSLLQGKQHFITKTRLFAPDGKSSRIQSRTPTLKERLMAPAGANGEMIMKNKKMLSFTKNKFIIYY